MATELGKAYVQIVPSAKGISGSVSKIIDPESEKAGKTGGASFTKSFASFAKKALIAVGIGKMIGDALNEGGQLQQSIGGIETLFKDSADKMKAFAADAYKTVGVSANQYMQNVTGFSASLLQSLGGDTSKAADIANMAMIDMSDNANKMGTDMASIQTAYQGFAKQNYTMLDNLKLGYGGTKTEMERLLKDAQAITGVKYDINSLADVYNAIHVIQGELDITGTTAREASTTLEGSFNSMKAAFSDLLGNMATGGDVKGALEALTQTTATWLFGNFLPMVGQIVSQVPTIIVGAVQGIATYADEIINTGVDLVIDIVQGVISAVPQLVETCKGLVTSFINVITSIDWAYVGSELISKIDFGIIDRIPAIIKSVGEMVNKAVGYIMAHLPEFLQKGYEIVVKIAQGIAAKLPAILEAMAGVLGKVVATIAKNLPAFLAKGIEIVGKLVAGIIGAIPQILAAAARIGHEAIKGLTTIDWKATGKNIVDGIGKGISNAGGAIKDKLMSTAKKAWEGVKKFFGIHSPSTLMEKTIGRMIPLGMAEGIEANAKAVTRAMNDLSQDAYNAPLEATMAYNAQMLGGAQNTPQNAVTAPVTINIDAHDYNSAKDIAQEVKNMLMHEIDAEQAVFA